MTLLSMTSMHCTALFSSILIHTVISMPLTSTLYLSFHTQIEEALSMASEEKGEKEGDKDTAAARSVLQSSEGVDMGQVHSTRSVTAMIKSSRGKQLGDTLQNQGAKVLNHVSSFQYSTASD